MSAIANKTPNGKERSRGKNQSNGQPGYVLCEVHRGHTYTTDCCSNSIFCNRTSEFLMDSSTVKHSSTVKRHHCHSASRVTNEAAWASTRLPVFKAMWLTNSNACTIPLTLDTIWCSVHQASSAVHTSCIGRPRCCQSDGSQTITF